MNFALLDSEVQGFINEHLDGDPVKLLLKPAPFSAVSMPEIVEQIRGKRKCRQKLPVWYQTPGIYYPPPLAMEQCSSALTGAYKASLCAGNTLADLTGGAGVDSFFFSGSFREVIHVEQSARLSAIAAYNLPLLGARNIRFICGDGMKILQEEKDFDWIYLDPSRRSREHKKVFLPGDYQPDFVPHLDLLVSRAPQVMIKTSPLVDLRFGIHSFRYVRAIHVVAVKNECKEILWILGREPLADPPVTCADIREERTTRFVFDLSTEEKTPPLPLSGPSTFLYEPGAAILKGGAFKTVGIRFGLAKLHVNSHLYTGGQLLEDFPGRAFKILDQMTAREFGARFRGRQMHISTRNFPAHTASLLKRYAITEGGEDYAFFTTTGKNKRTVLLCRKI